MPFPTGKKRLGEKAADSTKRHPIKKHQVLPLISKLQGNISRIADTLGSTRGTIRKVIQSDPDLMQALEDSRERRIDELEEATHMDALERQDATMRIFLLKTLGKHRGYEQDEGRHAAQDVARAAFEFINNKSKNPAEPSTHIPQATSYNPI